MATKKQDEPLAQPKVSKATQKQVDEVREIQKENFLENQINVPGDVGTVSAGVADPRTARGKQPVDYSFEQIGEERWLRTKGDLHFANGESWAAFVRKVRTVSG